MAQRTWTNEQLAAAVASQHSWRGVLRALGLKGTSAGVIRSVKRHADRLDLDTSHFTGVRRWSDQKLREAIAQADSWADVLRSLELSDSARTRVKGHAVRLGLDVAHMEPSPSTCPPTTELLCRSAEPRALRRAAPSIAMAWFTLRGLPVALPFEPEEFDLLVTMPERIQRVQVKSTTNKSHTGKWEVSIGRRPYSVDKSIPKAPYDPDSIDYFFIVDGAGGIYLIPMRVIAGRVAISLASYREYKVGSAAGLLSSGEAA